MPAVVVPGHGAIPARPADLVAAHPRLPHGTAGGDAHRGGAGRADAPGDGRRCRRPTRPARSRSTRAGAGTRCGSIWRRSGSTWGSRIRRDGGLRAACAALASAASCGPSRARRLPPVPARRPAGHRLDRRAGRVAGRGPVVLVDIRTDVFAYLRGHLPGAVYLNTETLRASRGGIPTRLLDGAGVRRAVLPSGSAVRPAGGDLQRGGDPQHRRDVPRVAPRRVRPPPGVRARRRLLQVAARAAAGGPAVSSVGGDAFPAAPFQPEQASLADVRARAPNRRRDPGGRPAPRSVRGRSGRADPPRTHSRRDQPLLAGRSDSRRIRVRVEGQRRRCGRRTRRRASRPTRTSSPTATAPPRRATCTSRCGICWGIRGCGCTWGRGRNGRSERSCRIGQWEGVTLRTRGPCPHGPLRLRSG